MCARYGVPVLIDDRVDVALAAGAAGVHIGQTDMPVADARALLGPHAVIGKTCNTVEQVREAVAEGVDYVGLGPVWGTQTKKVSVPPAGPIGMAELLAPLEGTSVKAVAIGAISTAYAVHCV